MNFMVKSKAYVVMVSRDNLVIKVKIGKTYII